MRTVMIVPSGPKRWDWSTLETEGLGGSESAAIYLADSLARLGHDVTLMGARPAPDSPAGVHYAESAPNNGWDIAIVSRVPQWLPDVQAKTKLFWAHDMMNPDMVPHTPTDCDIILALSRFAAQCFGGSRVCLMPNGIDPALYEAITPGVLNGRTVGKLAWTSNYDRGLFIAIRTVQALRKQWPQLELHVYGGMAVYGWPEERERLYVPDDLTGVVFHGPQTKAQLAEELATCWAWFYPTWWPETFCIAALEAQAAGTPCITVPVGALPETVVALPPSYDIETAIEKLLYPPTWQGYSKRAADYARKFTWDSVAQGLMGALAA